jgi:hypothetical protein
MTRNDYIFSFTLLNAETGNAAHFEKSVRTTSYFKAWQIALGEALKEASRRGGSWIVERIESVLTH